MVRHSRRTFHVYVRRVQRSPTSRSISLVWRCYCCCCCCCCCYCYYHYCQSPYWRWHYFESNGYRSWYWCNIPVDNWFRVRYRPSSNQYCRHFPGKRDSRCRYPLTYPRMQSQCRIDYLHRAIESHPHFSTSRSGEPANNQIILEIVPKDCERASKIRW